MKPGPTTSPLASMMVLPVSAVVLMRGDAIAEQADVGDGVVSAIGVDDAPALDHGVEHGGVGGRVGGTAESGRIDAERFAHLDRG